MASPRAASQVTFSDMSRLFVYEDEEVYRNNIAYNKEEYDAISAANFYETIRLRNQISSAPYDSPVASLRHIIKTETITIHEVIGIENSLLYKPSYVKKVRKKHSKAVLQKQHEQRQQELEDPVKSLAEFATKSSSKSIFPARVRALWTTHLKF